LYRRGGAYEYSRGLNSRAMAALASGIVLALVGLVIPPLKWLYDYAWFVGFAASSIVYYVATQRQGTFEQAESTLPAARS
jgi:NCS1 family nucleobase:cation symporter-1